MKIFAIDPGNEKSAFLVMDFNPLEIFEFGILPNHDLKQLLTITPNDFNLFIEMIASYGMPVGKTVFDTCVWIGRFMESFNGLHTLVYRKEIVLNLCGSVRAKDGNVRRALMDKFGEPGTKKNPGFTYGISKDVWSALAVANYGYYKLKYEK